MLRKTLKIAAAAGAIMISAPLMAQAHGGGHPGGMPGGAMGSMGAMHSQGPMYASPMGISHANEHSVLYGATPTTRPPSYSTNSQAMQHSQALMHASPTGIAHANQNSVLARGGMAATSPQLAGLATGLPVMTNSGGTLGSVSQVITGPDGMIRGVVVTSATGQTYTISPSMITGIANGTVSTAYTG